MGDVFHTFPALTDAQKALPGLQVDWVVEKGFADIPSWHPVVDQVYPIEIRRWRKSLLSSETRKEIKAFFCQLKQNQYDLVLDAQGLLKSAWVGTKIKAPMAGYDWSSAREPLASLFYTFKYSVAKDQHAILRLRQLFAQALNYPFDNQQTINSGLDTQNWQKPRVLVEQFEQNDYWVFLHGTTWDTKLYPEEAWLNLLDKAHEQGKKVMLPWGNEEEKQRALRLKEQAEIKVGQAYIWVPNARLSLNDMAKALKHAQGVISVDTGLSHVCAALATPMVVIYRVTDPRLVGADGAKVIRLSSPCAPLYLKKFESVEQENESMRNIDENAVFAALQKQQVSG